MAALPKLLRAVQQDLVGFLTALQPWAQGISVELADPLTAALDQRLRISAPLGI
jgi:C4-dicarboxylate-specific signal transduction histidine kinase